MPEKTFPLFIVHNVNSECQTEVRKLARVCHLVATGRIRDWCKSTWTTDRSICQYKTIPGHSMTRRPNLQLAAAHLKMHPGARLKRKTRSYSSHDASWRAVGLGCWKSLVNKRSRRLEYYLNSSQLLLKWCQRVEHSLISHSVNIKNQHR